MPEPTPRRQTLWAVLVLIVLPLVWGYNWVIMKKALAFMGPFEFAAWRFIPGALFLFAILAAMKRPLTLQAPLSVLAVGFFQTAANMGLVMWALRGGPVGRGVILNYAMPIWVVLMSWPLLRERPMRIQWIASGFAALGIVCLFLSKSIHGRVDAAVLALLSGLSWAIGTVITRRLLTRHRMDPLTLTAWQMLFAGLMLAIVAVLAPGRPTLWHAPFFIPIMLWEIIPATALGWLLWTFFLKRVDAALAGLAVLASPLVGIAAGAIELHERPSGIEALGMGLVVLSLALVGPLALRQIRRASAMKTSCS
ncbi:MAG: Permease of the drug/metabolite transporter superfamily [Holophagaceae bacterium]|nr:Permease of the drug/metabolite transporter superfamily [Holophagaceae bacterium]